MEVYISGAPADILQELIKVNGLQVSPAELEKGLMAHEGVVDAAVVSFKK